MISISIVSNGRLEKTAVCVNGEQISGIRELFINIDEEGDFNSIIKYLGNNNEVLVKDIFNDDLSLLQISEPSFTEEELMSLQTLKIESDGDLDNTFVYWNEEAQEGIISLFIHIKAPSKEKKSGIGGIFGKTTTLADSICNAEITFREMDDSITVEKVF